jgi:copper(I)-binding protein
MIRHFILLAGLTLGGAGTVFAHEYKAGAIAIGHPWARPTADGAKAGAAYLSLENTSGEPDRLVGVTTPAAEKSEIHETSNDGGVMKMREVKAGVTLPPGENISFKPGGLHIMLFGLKQKLNEGQHIPLTLNFAKAGSVDVEVYVEKSPDSGQGAAMMHDHH